MGQNSATLHEPAEVLGPEVIDRHRAIASLMEELEAVDWYDQRIHACNDPDLKRILTHNRDEEKEHAAMVLEWLRRHDAALDAHLREYLFKEGEIVEVKSAAKAEPAGNGQASLAIGSLRGGNGQ